MAPTPSSQMYGSHPVGVSAAEIKAVGGATPRGEPPPRQQVNRGVTRYWKRGKSCRTYCQKLTDVLTTSGHVLALQVCASASQDDRSPLGRVQVDIQKGLENETAQWVVHVVARKVNEESRALQSRCLRYNMRAAICTLVNLAWTGISPLLPRVKAGAEGYWGTRRDPEGPGCPTTSVIRV